MKHCIYCGSELQEDSKFCGSCGKLQEPQQENVEAVTQEIAGEQPESPDIVQPKKKKKSILSRIFDAVVGIVFWGVLIIYLTDKMGCWGEGTAEDSSPYGHVWLFHQGDDKDATGKITLQECYVETDKWHDKDVIVCHVHVENTGDQKLYICQEDFSLYCDNQLVDYNYNCVESLSGVISPGRELDGEIAFDADPDDYSIVELEFAGGSVALKNNEYDIFYEIENE